MAADEAKRESQSNYTMLDGDGALDGTSYSTHVANEPALANSYEDEYDEETRRRRGGGVVLNRASNDVSIKQASSMTLRSSIAEHKLEAGDGAEGSGRFKSNEQADSGVDDETRRRRGGGIATNDARASDFPERSSSFVLRNSTQNKSVVERHQPEWTGTQ
jgi:hypothetical protein